jgi:hypothetical protein
MNKLNSNTLSDIYSAQLEINILKFNQDQYDSAKYIKSIKPILKQSLQY